MAAADVRAQALDSLHTELVSEERRGLFLHYGGLCVLLMVLQAGRSSSHTPMDILMQLTEPSRKHVSNNTPALYYRQTAPRVMSSRFSPRMKDLYNVHEFNSQIHIKRRKLQNILMHF